MLLDLPDVNLAAPYEEDAFSRQPRCNIINIVSLTQRYVFEIKLLEEPAQGLMVLEMAILATVPKYPSASHQLSLSRLYSVYFSALLLMTTLRIVFHLAAVVMSCSGPLRRKESYYKD